MNRSINSLSSRLFTMTVKGGGGGMGNIYFKKKFITDIIDIRIFV